MSSLVRPEFGPTLAEVSGARWPRVRLVLIVAAVVLALFVAYRWVVEPASTRALLVVPRPVAVNVLKDPRLEEAPLQGQEELRLRTRPGASPQQTFTITPLRLSAYRGIDPGGAMPVFAAHVISQMAKTVPNFQLRSEGRTRINLYPGYQIVYQTTIAGQRGYGKRIFLYPATPSPREGVQLDLTAPASPSVPNPDAVGANGALKLPLRSFNFGTERP